MSTKMRQVSQCVNLQPKHDLKAEPEENDQIALHQLSQTVSYRKKKSWICLLH